MSLFEPGGGIVFMRVGSHAGERLEDIVERKQREIADVGHAFWGFGGTTCHPRTMVQPFAEAFAKPERPVRLCLQEMVNDEYWGEEAFAAEYSIDGINFRPVPPEISVRGSRYAFVIENLREAPVELPLNRARIAIGVNAGRFGPRYLQGRVDKGCFEIVSESEAQGEPRTEAIRLIADLKRPYAVFLRGDRGRELRGPAI